MKLASQFRKLAVAPPESQKEAAAFSFGFDVDPASIATSSPDGSDGIASKNKKILTSPVIPPSSSLSSSSPSISASSSKPESKLPKKVDRKSPAKLGNQISAVTSTGTPIVSISSPSNAPLPPTKPDKQEADDGIVADDHSDSEEGDAIDAAGGITASGISASGATATSNKKKKKKNKKKSKSAVDTGSKDGAGGSAVSQSTADNEATAELSKEEIVQNIARLKAQKELADKKKAAPSKTPASSSSSSTPHGPKVLSAKDPVLSEEERSHRRFGHGVNVCAIGPRNKVRDPLWVEHHGGLPSSSAAAVVTPVQSYSEGADEGGYDSDIRTVTNPFSFGFF